MAAALGESPQQGRYSESANGSLSQEEDDPFAIETPQHPPHPHRYSSFDTQLFAWNHPSSSPAQAKRALEAHLAETDRRIQEASKLGTTLVQQRVNLSQRLRDVSSQEEESQISPELRQKLIEIEKEYNEVGRQSAKAFLGPKSDTQGANGSNAPFALNGRNTASPTKFSSQATDSPSKVNVPRRQRNQASKTDDIEFAAEITTSLLGQVRHLQAVLAERDDALKTTNMEKSRLELEAEGFSQRLRSLDESEQRYKDDNWNLETQMQEINATVREAASREQKLLQNLSVANSEKNAAQRELDELKQDHNKATEDHALMRKNQESELANLRKSVNLGESERGSLQRKVDELTSQNQELANGIAGRFRDDAVEPQADTGGTIEDFSFDLSEREHSPPPSPTKGVHRNSMLESETLKSSLHHAHRMIQNLKSNVHREKTEKQDLKRMLQEARDELEIRRAEPHERRLKSKSQTDIRKAGRPGLGAARNSRTDIMVDDAELDPNWEDHNSETTPSRSTALKPLPGNRVSGANQIGDSSDAYQTANETEDAFETATERDTTDNDAFQTGAESLAGDSSDELTETESGVARTRTVRDGKSSALASAKPGDRRSLQSTASTSEDEDNKLYTPVQGQPQRYRLKLNRNARRSRLGNGNVDSSNPSSAKNSPASFVNGGGVPIQSLFNELENLSGDDNDGTPSKGSISSPRSVQSLQKGMSNKRSSSSMRRRADSISSTSGQRPNTVMYTGEAPPVPRIPTVDIGVMTEPWEPMVPQQTSQEVTQKVPAESVPKSDSSSTLPATSAAAITSRIFGSQPATPQNKVSTPEPTSGSNIGSSASATSVPPRPVWDQPLQMFSGLIPGFNQSANTTPLSTRSATSQVRGVSEGPPSFEHSPQPVFNAAPESTRDSGYTSQGQPETPPASMKRTVPALALSPIQSLDIAPVQPSQKPNAKESAEESVKSYESPETTGARNHSDSTGGILGSMFNWNMPKAAAAPYIAEDETSQNISSAPAPASIPDPTLKEGKMPLSEVVPNAINQDSLRTGPTEAQSVTNPVDMADHSAQTILSSEQIDGLLTQKARTPVLDIPKTPAAATMKPLSDIGAVSPPPLAVNRFSESTESFKGKGPEIIGKDSLGRAFRRPVSAASLRSRPSQYPPLPPDHQEAIAAAAQRTPSTEPGAMGPPLAPASAYTSRYSRSRNNSRPETPSQQGYPSPSSRGGTTPRAGRYSTRSRTSRRSSVSSFASELDERFNIRTDGMPMPQGVGPNTDPRMIQAITQTMIGEMMWKYTRKAGRGEMSSTRHRRFFWVHPYTRTLYWSDRDPATADRAQLKSKSVAIEAVRVVTDDNPMPPGLHRKSLIIVTPGRSVKFTAQTSQRHETWFNALSYLLLRTGADGTTNNGGDLTDADVEEFNPRYNRNTSRSRVSLASFKSNRNRNREDLSRLSAREASGPTTADQSQSTAPEPTHKRESVRSRISRSLSRSRGSRAPLYESGNESATNDPMKHASISSRLSNFGGSVRHSMRSRSSIRQEAEGQGEPGVLHGGRSVVSVARGDSAEDLRRVIEEREKKGDLENVRSCCDGRHDVGALSKSGRHHSHAGSTYSVQSQS